MPGGGFSLSDALPARCSKLWNLSTIVFGHCGFPRLSGVVLSVDDDGKANCSRAIMAYRFLAFRRHRIDDLADFSDDAGGESAPLSVFLDHVA